MPAYLSVGCAPTPAPPPRPEVGVPCAAFRKERLAESVGVVWTKQIKDAGADAAEGP